MRLKRPHQEDRGQRSDWRKFKEVAEEDISNGEDRHLERVKGIQSFHLTRAT